MVKDFADRLTDTLRKREGSYLDKLVAAQAVDHDRMAGRIAELRDVIKIVDTTRRDFLVEEDAQ